MRRFFIEKIIKKKGLCVIPEREAKHMVKVLRMKQGDRFVLMDGAGNRFETAVENISRYEVTAKIIKELAGPSSSPVTINLFQALLKSRMMDYMIEKTSELGVSSVMPFFSGRTVIRLDEGRALNKTRHWREIARSAAKQSGRNIPAEISEPLEFNELLKSAGEPKGLKVVLWEGENATDLKEILKSEKPASDFTGIIGPEGGFTENEIDRLRSTGFKPVSLGSRILRAETAAIVLTAVIQYEWGDLGIQ